MAQQGHTVDRRTVLKNLAVGGAVAAGLPSGTAASSLRRPSVAAVEDRFADVATVERVFEENAGPLVGTLADRGYLESAADPGVSVDSALRTREYLATDAGNVATAAPGRIGDTRVVDVRVRQQTATHEIEYHLVPDADDDGYALVTPGGDGQTVLVRPGSEERDVSTESCPVGCSCETRCTTDFCDCRELRIWYTEETETCVVTSEGICLCNWDESGCDCEGELVDQCPS